VSGGILAWLVSIQAVALSRTRKGVVGGAVAQAKFDVEAVGPSRGSASWWLSAPNRSQLGAKGGGGAGGDSHRTGRKDTALEIRWDFPGSERPGCRAIRPI